MNTVRFFKQFFGSSTKESANSHETAPSPSHDQAHSGDSDDHCPKLQPKRQKDRRQKPTAATTLARPERPADIVFEEFNDPNDPKPRGYAGTIGGVRFSHSTVEDYCPCGTGGGHYLSYGHTIVGDVECGSNCKGGVGLGQPFSCPQCQVMVKDVLKNRLAQGQKEKINSLRLKNDSLAIPVAVGYVTKHVSSTTANIAQTVMSVLTPDYGRKCQDVPGEPHELNTFAELYKEHRSTLEQKSRARVAEDRLGPLNKHQKRKASAQAADPAAAREETVTLVASKRRKGKLNTHREPITEVNRGVKRAISDEDGIFSDAETLVDNDSPSPTIKKLKQKLQVHHEPLPLHARRVKRKLSVSEEFANSAQPSKRRMSSFPVSFGEAKFMPTPASLGWVLERKRQQSVAAHHDAENKRSRVWEVLPGKEVHVPEGKFGA